MSPQTMRRLLQESVAHAREELSEKTLRQVQYDTAFKWAGRALVAGKMGLMEDAHEYAHEAAEHAALTGDAKLLAHIWSAFRAAKIEY